MNHRLIISLCFLTMASTAEVTHGRLFMSVEDVHGPNPAQYEEWSEIDGFHFATKSDIQLGGGQIGSPMIETFSVGKGTDMASPQLWEINLTGRRTHVDIHVTEQFGGGRLLPVARWEFGNAAVTSYDFDFSPEGATETLGLDAVTAVFTLIDRDANGLEVGMVETSWDFVQNRPVGQPAPGQIDFKVGPCPEAPSPVTADFNHDGLYDTLDVDALVGAVVTNPNDLTFDLTENGTVDEDDLTKWLADAATQNGFAEPYLLGDANLDGAVNATDLNELALNWQGIPNTWSGGDFNADGIVGAADLNALGINWRAEIPISAAASVPEPSVIGLMVAGISILSMVGHRHRRANSTNVVTSCIAN